MRKGRLAGGFALALLVTALLAGTVVTSAAITVELTDGDTCETGGTSYVRPTPTPDNVKMLAGNVTGCIADGSDPGAGPGGPPAGSP